MHRFCKFKFQTQVKFFKSYWKKHFDFPAPKIQKNTLSSYIHRERYIFFSSCLPLHRVYSSSGFWWMQASRPHCLWFTWVSNTKHLDCPVTFFPAPTLLLYQLMGLHFCFWHWDSPFPFWSNLNMHFREVPGFLVSLV